MLGSPWQRCTVHFLRDLRGHCRKDQRDALGAVIRQLFTAENGDDTRRRLGDAVTQLQARLPKIAALLEDAEDDVLAFYAFPLRVRGRGARFTAARRALRPAGSATTGSRLTSATPR